MKRLIYALVAASTLGLAAGGLALAADDADQQSGTVQQDESIKGSTPMPPSTVKQSDGDKEQSGDTQGDTKSDSDSK